MASIIARPCRLIGFNCDSVSDDTPIAGFFTLNRFVRIADGPDEVHMSQLGKQKIAEYVSANQR